MRWTLREATAGELAATVLRTLALPKIVDLRPRLVPELAVHASFAGDGEKEMVSGIADAVALAPDGSVEVVVDWKNDVAPTAQIVDGLSGPGECLHPSDGCATRANRSDDIWNCVRSAEMTTSRGACVRSHLSMMVRRVSHRGVPTNVSTVSSELATWMARRSMWLTPITFVYFCGAE